MALVDFDLELNRVVEEIIKQGAKTVCIQLPDGLKPRAGEITDFLKEKTGVLVLIWLGSCFGACDVPPVDKLGVDLLVQWGHSEFR
ncbi:MAG: diphthamide synthesis protein [Candidatus Woesearchaeota archaeon]|nr:diphthamide synthesis protein [Candidatus Woesearchaeota archaeon]